MIHRNVVTDFSPQAHYPDIDDSAFIHPLAAVIGNVHIGRRVFVSPFASVRGDEGQPLHIGNDSNVQDGVIIHALETEQHGGPVVKNLVEMNGTPYGVYIGERVSLAHQVQVHGPASIGNDCFIGMKSLVFKARIDDGCVIEPGCIVMGVHLKEHRIVPVGTVLKNQKDADMLPTVSDEYVFKDLNREVVHVNTSLAEGYNKADITATTVQKKI